MSASSARLIAALALVITFMAGVVVGIVAGHAMILHGIGAPHPSAEFITRRLDRRLHFSDPQRAQVIAIIDRHQKRITGIWAGVRPAVHQEVESANVEIDRVLTPEQRVEFAKIRMHVVPRRGGDGIRFKHD